MENLRDRYMPSSMGEPASLLLPSQGTAGMIPDCVPDNTSGSPFQHSFSITSTCNPSPPLQPTGPTAHHVGVNSSPPLQHVQNGYSPSLSPERIHTLQPPCTDQPYLRFLEQPTNRIRYRYKSEKGSHGGLTGEFSTTTKKTYPTVKLENYQQHNCQVYIKAILYTVDDQPKPHVHKLMGKHCQDGVCTVTVGEDMVASFQNLGILFVGKKEVPDILFRRKLEDQHILSCLMQNGSSHLAETDKHHLREEAEREAKDMDLNRVRIRFEAFAVSQGNSYPGHLYPICDAVYSNIIANQKCPDVGELKIVRMDKCSGLCTGSDEVFLLCEKVNKKDIKVMFFEEDENGMILWQDFGSFTEADVHHQVAIVFKTPPYHDPMIKFPVKVKLQLYRPRDRECSKPKDFVYIPVEHDREGIERKRRKVHSYQNFPGFDGGCNNFGPNHSFGSTGGSGSSGGNNSSFFGHGQGPVDFQGQNVLSTSQTRLFQSEEVIISLREERKVNQELASGVSLSTEKSLEASLDRLSLVEHGVRKMGSQKSEKLSGQVTSASQSHYPSDRTSPKTQTRGQRSSGITQETPEVLYKATDTGVFHHPESTADSDRPDLWPVRQLALQMSLALREFICSGDLRRLLVTMRHLVAIQDTEGDNLLHLAIIHHAGNHTNQLVLIRCLLHVLKDLPKDAVNQSNNLHQTPLMLAVMTKSPYIVQELLVHGANPNITDVEGNTPLHIASHNGDEVCLSVLLDPKNHPDEVTKMSSSLNKLNYAGFAPLHLAVKQGHKKCVKILCARGADVNVMDGTSGHTPLHMAVVWSPHLIRTMVKMGHLDINAQNFAGNTALHLACAYANEEVVSVLVKAGANVMIENYDTCSPNDQSGNESDVPNSKGKTPLDFSGNHHQLKKLLLGLSSHAEDTFSSIKSSPNISKLCSSSVSDLKKPRDSKIGKVERDESTKFITDTLTPFDSGYISGEIKTEDLDKMDLLFIELDQNRQWKQLGMTLGFEDTTINSIERLCGKDQSPAKAIIEKFKEEHPHCDLKETLTNALIAAALPTAVEIIH
ncbi:nuclear factor NF-kappa-B p105 subunit-like isoform X2 [Tachypleus tridentatus]|uniref:nuclear factor NF-kappa-B p105 subunit-like isoform X2 n=1 Tax=Tachypleus tridentatus TaxID=6853 RepID=UPI003FD63404